MNTIPDTVNYMILGYVVIFGVIAAYVGSLMLRFRSLHQDELTLDELEKDQN